MTRRRQGHGWTVIGLLTGLAMIGIVASVSVPACKRVLRQVVVWQVVTDIEAIGGEIRGFEHSQARLPTTLDEVDGGPYIDRWGNPYQYLPSTAKNWDSQRRLDRFLVPLNSDFDLYSLGPDGVSRPLLTSPHTWDDIVWADDGSYIGPTNEF